MPEAGGPLTVEDLVCPPEPEAGRELQFCPIRGLPIVRSQRVRSLPGFHLLSLDAGKEALARGSYQAFGKQFPCQNLEYLHADDKVFICTEDHKAFLNQMSMQYHRYIRHELEERKAERRRIRARAVERKARSEAHAAQAQQRQQVQNESEAPHQPQQAQPHSQDPRVRAAPPASAAATAAVAAAAPLPTPGEVAESADEPTTTAVEDPYAAPATGEDPYLEAASAADAFATAPSAALGAAAAEASAAAAQPATAAAAIKRVAGALARAGDKLAAQVAASPGGSQQPRPDANADAEDLYGDMGDDKAKRQRTASAYATAIGAMLDDDFDEDE